MALAAPAAAYDVFTPVSDYADVGDEPNGPADGVRFNWRPYRSPERSYGEDNNIGLALAGQKALVLDARPVLRETAPGQDVTALWLLSPFTGRDFVHPETTFRVLYGEWADANADRIVQDAEQESKGVVTPLTLRATAATSTDEFVGVTGAKIVSYVTGYSFRAADPVNYFQQLGYAPTSGDAPWEEYIEKGDGYYHSLIRTTAFGALDNDLLVTHVMETYEGGLDATSSDRTYKPIDGKPVDLDVYRSIDNSVESIYGTTLNAIVDNGQTVNRTVWSPTLEPIAVEAIKATQGQDSTVGPAQALVLPKFPNDVQDAFGSNDHDYAANWHPWVNFGARFGVAAPTPTLLLSAATFEVSPTANGKVGVAPGVLYPRIYHGVWYDGNADGFITDGDNTINPGSEEPSPGCDDLYDCGVNFEPNEYTDATNGGNPGNREFKTVCASDGIDFTMTPLTPDGSWTGGVYVFGPDDEGARDDETTPIVRDASDGNVDRLVLSGVIEATSSCNASNTPYQYFSDHKFVFPAGNPTFGIRFETEEECTDLRIVGIPTTECTKDVDVLDAWV